MRADLLLTCGVVFCFGILLQDSQGDTPLHYAITADYKVIIEILTEVPNIDFTVQNCQGFNLLHYSALKGNKL